MLFSSNDRTIAASEAFTNRQAQWQAVTAGLAEHIRHVTCADLDVEDLEAPRRNILEFHGVGGIGKSTLSRKIEASLARSEHRPGAMGIAVAGLPLPEHTARARWIGGEQKTRERWRDGCDASQRKPSP
ncbi:hypothetical protein [Streptomyces sp. NPDC005476]|uniref:hypothetical protein n=1 Tax=Streptomyces sp. NPDC005476 TaxID=3156882 RepID=UPI00345300DE